ncbi:MAG: hypothetical protein M3021_11385, partial [Actinomycetota bacterium]|nr:hypothetical protein [Actinomycetota bacterium]
NMAHLPKGQVCRCFRCGTEVYPQPLEVDIDPEDAKLRLSRGYVEMALVHDKPTDQLRLQARLFCPICASPALMLQNEQVLQTPSRAEDGTRSRPHAQKISSTKLAI